MTNLYKEVLYIIILSVFLGFIRYLFLDDYKLLNPKVEKSIVNYEDEDLKNYLLELSSPKVIDIEKAKFIYDHKLAIFIATVCPATTISPKTLKIIAAPENILSSKNIPMPIGKPSLKTSLVVSNENGVNSENGLVCL